MLTNLDFFKNFTSFTRMEQIKAFHVQKNLHNRIICKVNWSFPNFDFYFCDLI